MSFEIKNCKVETLLEYNARIPCKDYDDAIYDQLPEHQKRLIKACGYARLDSEKAFESMLLDIHFLDSYAKKTKGDPFDTKTTFEERFLKPAKIENQDMLIPYSPVPAKSLKFKPHLDFAQTKTLNNTGAHSIFLYVEPKKRSYEELLFDCKPPGAPPPTPPEVLAMQIEVLEQLEMQQKQYLQAIQLIISTIKDTYKQTSILLPREGKKPIKTLLGEINAYKAKEKDEKKIVQTYNTYMFQVFSALEEKKKEEIELEQDLALKVKYEKLILEAKAPESATATSTEEGVSMSSPQGWVEGTKKLGKMLWGDLQFKYKEVRAWVYKKMPGYPSKQDMQELQDRLFKHEQAIAKLTAKLESIKKTVVQLRSALPPWYSQTAIEKFVDTSLTLEAYTVSPASLETMEAEKQTYLKNCKELEVSETSSEAETYANVASSLRRTKDIFVSEIHEKFLVEEESEDTTFTKKVILNYMLQVPIPNDDSFNEYKTIWGYGGCAPSGYYAPPLSTSKETSFLLPSFDSYISMVLRYQTLQTISGILTSR